VSKRFGFWPHKKKDEINEYKKKKYIVYVCHSDYAVTFQPQTPRKCASGLASTFRLQYYFTGGSHNIIPLAAMYPITLIRISIRVESRFIMETIQ
jgi:hypothetical protein